jgi:hypothetical protein
MKFLGNSDVPVAIHVTLVRVECVDNLDLTFVEEIQQLRGHARYWMLKLSGLRF